jgi:hypothetical protein
MKLAWRYLSVMLVMTCLITLSYGRAQNESNSNGSQDNLYNNFLEAQMSPLGAQNAFSVDGNQDYVRDGYMTIAILPAGIVELSDPLERRLIHPPKGEDQIEIPHASYGEESAAEEEPLSGQIYINSPIGGHYVLKISNIPDKKYTLDIIVENEENTKSKTILLTDVPIAKGQTHLYDIQFDKTNYLVNAILRK